MTRRYCVFTNGDVPIVSVNELMVLPSQLWVSAAGFVAAATVAAAAAAAAETMTSSGVGGLSKDTLFPLVLLVGWLLTPARFQPASDTDSFLSSLTDDAAHLLDGLVIVGCRNFGYL